MADDPRELYDGEPIDDDEGVEPYVVVVKVTAAGRLEAVEPRHARFVLRSRIAGLVGDPRPLTAECLPGYADRFPLRHRGYRVLYSIDESRKLVTIMAIAYPQR